MMVDDVISTIKYIEQSVTIITIATHVAICFAYHHIKSRKDGERKEILSKIEETQFLISDHIDDIQKTILSIRDGRIGANMSADAIYNKAVSGVKETLIEAKIHDIRDVSATAEAICEEKIKRDFQNLFRSP